jgi:nucleotide-binding universal stress UspA family protein
VRFDKILFPVDFSDRCRGASQYVKAFAERFGSKVILLHVLESTIGQPGDLDFGGISSSLQWEDRAARAKELLDNFLAAEFGSLNVERRLETGDPARTIVRTAHAEEVNLVMLPTHGYGGFRRFILGSVTAKVLHDVNCPVWTGVHLDQPARTDAVEYRSIVCAVDVTQDNTVALRAAREFAQQYGATLTLAHAVPGSEAFPEKLLDVELRQHLIRQAREQIATLCEELDIRPDHVCIEGGEVSHVVSACAKHHGADLVIIGRGHHSGFGRLRTHSYAIIRESPCPVISV